MLIKNVPGIEKPLKVVLGEENPFESVTESFDNMKNTVTGFFGGGDSKKEDVKPSSKLKPINNRLI